jgi:hypothetical protein
MMLPQDTLKVVTMTDKIADDCKNGKNNHALIIPLNRGYRMVSSRYFGNDKTKPIFELQEKGLILFWRWKTFFKWYLDEFKTPVSLDTNNQPIKKS